VDDQQRWLICHRADQASAIGLDIEQLEREVEEIFLTNRAKDQARNRHVRSFTAHERT
jgi:hypothetical protein